MSELLNSHVSFISPKVLLAEDAAPPPVQTARWQSPGSIRVAAAAAIGRAARAASDADEAVGDGSCQAASESGGPQNGNSDPGVRAAGRGRTHRRRRQPGSTDSGTSSHRR